VIPERIERRARWVLDSIGATELGFGDDVPYHEEAWDAIDLGERPVGDALAEGFFHLARLEELDARRDVHGRFRAAWSSLDPLDPPLERLRGQLAIEAPRWDGATFAVALTHDVDAPWRWTPIGVRGAAARLKADVSHARLRRAAREAKGLALVPLHRARGTDPNWRFREIVAESKRRGATSATFFLLAAHRDPHDGSAPEVYAGLRPRLIGELNEAGAEIGLHTSYTAADDDSQIERELRTLRALGARVTGNRYHYLRVDPHRNLRDVERADLSYDTTLGFPDALGFRAGIARPFRPWDVDRDAPLDLVEIPLAIMDVTLAERRYLGLSARAAWPRLERLLDWAAANGAAFAVLWHPDRFDAATAAGWDRLYYRLLDGIRERGGVCVPAAELANRLSGR
jgi:peptidoglycan/xylan/chitin deacetylase (PgdA/CDA1 family)